MKEPTMLLKGRAMPLAFLLSLLFTSLRVAAQNDNCAGAIPLTVGVACVNTAGTTVGATQSMLGCSGTADDDVWYRFVATGGTPTITVSSPAVAGRISDIVFQVFSGSCAGLTSIACINATTGNVSETTTLPNLINGNTYYIRVYSNANGAGQGIFNICITRPAAPANDNCATATVLTPAATCVNGTSQTTGTLVNATGSGIAAACGGSSNDDVWYRFTAAHTSQIITLSGLGANIAVTGAGMGGSAVLEVMSGVCGALTTIACGQISNNNLVAYANSLTVGTQYYVRVHSTNSVSLTATAGFTICITNPPITAPVLFFGKSFINITKGIGGGTVEPGDVLEIRAAVVLRPNTVLDSCAFYDNLPAGTSYVPGSLAILTNEGKVYKAFTDAAGDDAGTYAAGAITINMGYRTGDNTATATQRGRLRNTNYPTVGGTSCVMLASYRVTVTATLNTTISLGGGSFTYALVVPPYTLTTYTYNANNVKVYTNTGLCTNASGVNVLDAGLAGDYSGTFGSGNTINRVATPNMPPGHTYVTQIGGKPGDFEYTVSNNMSNTAAGYSTVNTWPKPESPVTHRIFGVWDVIGDHTGATNPLTGNPAADTTGGKVGGYMLLVNSAYSLDTVFRYPISGLCPNTFYEISFWVRNVCSRCGMDSVGRGASGVSVPAGYIPTDIGDSSGVYPNLGFSIDGVNHYTTGNIKYTGEWVKKGFVFQTGPAQTSIVFSIYNNAPGGGGNDWALDDISLSTCTPNLNLVPSGNSQVCYGNQVDLNCQVISYFNNYIYYQWQVSHDNGATWTDTLTMGTGTPVLSGGYYQYTALFPSFIADSSQHLTQYRIRVATTPANLYSGCSFYNSANIIVMVNNCMFTLKTDLIYFKAKKDQDNALLEWNVTNQNDRTVYDVERSTDGIHFNRIGQQPALQAHDSYSFRDPQPIGKQAYYRLVLREPGGFKYSTIQLLSTGEVVYELLSVVNPFHEQLRFDISFPVAGTATFRISDQQGRLVKEEKQLVNRGLNTVTLNQLNGLSAGTYVLQVIVPQGMKTARILKQ